MKIKPTSKPGSVNEELGQGDEAMVESIVVGSRVATAPFRLRKILVPTDFSVCSTKALDYALAFARPFQAEIILQHVVEPVYFPVYNQDIPPDWGVIEADLLQASQEHLARFSREKADAYEPLRLLVSEGGAYSEIVACAKAEEVDLIIIATHGHKGLRHALLGSTAERVVRHAPCPVLTVREREHEFLK